MVWAPFQSGFFCPLIVVDCVHDLAWQVLYLVYGQEHTSAVFKYIWLMPHKIVLPSKSFKSPLEAISSRLLFNRPCLNVNCTYLSQTHSFFFPPPSFVRGFLFEKYVTNGLWINKKPNWIRLSCKVIVKSLKAPTFYSDFKNFPDDWVSPFFFSFFFFFFLRPIMHPFVILSRQWFKAVGCSFGVIYLPKQSH